MNQRTPYVLRVLTFVLSTILVIFSASTAPADEGAKESSAEPAKMLIGAWQLKEAKNPGSPSGEESRLSIRDRDSPEAFYGHALVRCSARSNVGQNRLPARRTLLI
jgi:hypothetical protein